MPAQNLAKRLLSRLVEDFGSVFFLLAPTSAFLTVALVKDSILYGDFLPNQRVWILCGLATTVLLSTLLFFWIAAMVRLLRDLLCSYGSN